MCHGLGALAQVHEGTHRFPLAIAGLNSPKFGFGLDEKQAGVFFRAPGRQCKIMISLKSKILSKITLKMLYPLLDVLLF